MSTGPGGLRSGFAVFNATGQPAASVLWFLDGESLPVSVQLVGRPSDEATLRAECTDRGDRPGGPSAAGFMTADSDAADLLDGLIDTPAPSGRS